MTNAMAADRSTLVLDSRLDELDRLAAAVEGLCAGAGREAEAPAFTLCADELFTNIVLHGWNGEPGHPVEVVLTRDAAGLTVELIDDAPAFDPTEPVAPDLDAAVEERAIGGLGRHLVSTLMDRFCYRRADGRNHVAFGRAATNPEGDARGGDG